MDDNETNIYNVYRVSNVNINGSWFYKVVLCEGDRVVLQRFFRKKARAVEFGKLFEKSMDHKTVLLLAKLVTNLKGVEEND
jgi:hypothetical protein